MAFRKANASVAGAGGVASDIAFEAWKDENFPPETAEEIRRKNDEYTRQKVEEGII